jgi:hypothetical protein
VGAASPVGGATRATRKESLPGKETPLPENTHLRRPAALVVAGLLLLLAATLAGGWWYGAGRFGEQVDGWIAARRGEGWHIDASARRITGFPLRWTARFASLALTPPNAADRPPPWSWQGHAVTISWSLLDRQGLHLGTSGTNSLDVASDGRKLPILLDGETIDLRLDLAAQPVQHAVGSAAHMALSMPDFAVSADRLGFDISFDPQATLDHKERAATLSFDGDRVALSLPDRQQAPLPLSGSLSASLMGRPPAAPLAQAVAAWRDAGGTIELNRLDVRSGAVAVQADATIALDGEMRLLGAGTASISGFDKAVDELVASGHMAARDAPLAKIGFGALAKPDPKTGIATVSLPVTAENGFLYLGPIKIAALKPLKLD